MALPRDLFAVVFRICMNLVDAAVTVKCSMHHPSFKLSHKARHSVWVET